MKTKYPLGFSARPRFGFILLSLLVAKFFMVAQSVSAETEQKARSTLQMIQVVGQATSGLDSEITEEELNKVQANNLSDIFHADPVVTSGGSAAMSQKIYVRNVGEDILNITVDGAEQANAVFHHSGRISIEPELLKRVEVEAGTGSASAGPGALGGAVRFTTKDPEDLLKPGQNIGGMLKTGFFSNGGGNKISATVFGRDQADRLSAMVSLTQSDRDNVEDGNGDDIAGTESAQNLGYAKVVANISDAQYLSLSYEKLEEEGDVLYRPELIAFAARNVPEPTEGERSTATLNYGFTSESAEWLDVAFTLYNTEYWQEREFRGTAYDGAVESTGLTLQNTSRFSRHEWVYGINYRDDKSALNDVDLAPNTYFEEVGEVKGVYVQDIMTIGTQLTVSTGLRLDEYEVDDVNGQHFSDSGVSPNFSANYEIKSGLNVSAGYAEAFRGVEVEDAFRLSSSSYDEDLEAEKASNTELGFDYQKNQFYAGLSVYRTSIESLILRNPPWSRTVSNLEHALEIKGYLLSLAYAADKFGIAAKYLGADAEVNGETATRYVYSSKATSIGDTFTFDVYYKPWPNLEAGWIAEFVEKIEGIHQTVGGENLTVDKPGYALHNIYFQWLPLKDDRLAINLSVNNLLGEQYLSHASVENYQDNAGYGGISGSPEAGRDIRLSARFKF